jgi:hypothetical protein
VRFNDAVPETAKVEYWRRQLQVESCKIKGGEFDSEVY